MSYKEQNVVMGILIHDFCEAMFEMPPIRIIFPVHVLVTWHTQK